MTDQGHQIGGPQVIWGDGTKGLTLFDWSHQHTYPSFPIPSGGRGWAAAAAASNPSRSRKQWMAPAPPRSSLHGRCSGRHLDLRLPFPVSRAASTTANAGHCSGLLCLKNLHLFVRCLPTSVQMRQSTAGRSNFLPSSQCRPCLLQNSAPFCPVLSC